MTNFLRKESPHFHETSTLSNIAQQLKLLKNLTEGQIYHYTVAMISVILRSLRRICSAIFCNFYFQFYREGDN